MTRYSVIVNTYNRSDELERVLASVLAQRHGDYEVVVADDGSDDGTEALMRERRATNDPVPVRYVRQANAGLSAARNLGAAAAEGEYLIWLDDDDDVEPDWLATFDRAAADAGGDAAVLCVGARLVDPSGTTIAVRRPTALGPAFADQTGLFLPGSFAVRRDVFDAVGGFTVELRCSHQTELALRLLPRCAAEGWTVAHRPEPVLVQHRAAPGDRPRNDPVRLQRCTEWLLEHHADRLRLDRGLEADYHAIAGVAAARAGDSAGARRHLWEAVRARPTAPKAWGRLLAAAVPPVSRRVWPGPQRQGTGTSP